MLKFLPYENFTITTNLRPAEITKILEETVEPRKSVIRFTTQKAEKPYQGEIGTAGFSISRWINYRNSFLPQIKGKYERMNGKTGIQVKMHIHPFVLIFMTFWLGSTGGIFFLILFTQLGDIADGLPDAGLALLIPTGMFIFGWLLMNIGFHIEARISKTYLINLFQAEQVIEHTLIDLLKQL